MSDSEMYVWEGTCKFAQVYTPSRKFNKYEILFYPKNDETRKAIRSSGLRNSLKEDEDGFYYTFRRDAVNKFDKSENGPPKIVDAEGNPFSEKIGNGSTVEVAILVESFTSKEWGKVTRGTLEGVRVLKHIPYVKEETKESAPAPAQASTTPTPAKKPKIPF